MTDKTQPEFKSLADVRRAIRPLGFTLHTEMLSWGRHATYVHIDSKDRLNGNVFTPESLAKWKPILDWQHANRDALKNLHAQIKCYGLVHK